MVIDSSCWFQLPIGALRERNVRQVNFDGRGDTGKGSTANYGMPVKVLAGQEMKRARVGEGRRR